LLYHRAATALRHADSVVVCGHVRPDGDAIGSVLAATLALRKAGIAAVPTLADEDPAPATYAFLPGFALFTPASELETPAAFLALDAPTLERLGLAAQLAAAATTLVVMDHHPEAMPFGHVNILDSSAASTGELVWRLAATLEIAPTPEVALCCYVALMTDTGRFQYSNTSPEAFRDAAEMLEAGVDPAEASRLVYESRSASSIALEGRALSRITLANDGHVAFSWVDDEDFTETGAQNGDAERLIDSVRSLGRIDVAMLFSLRGDEVRVNLRAKTGFDVGGVARTFGGGGHRAASGFTVQAPMEDLLPKLLPLLPGSDGAPEPRSAFEPDQDGRSGGVKA
jgi:phosphoesterase RecJ-like protein